VIAMRALPSTREFSRLTHVSVEALRHYQDLDLPRVTQFDTDNEHGLVTEVCRPVLSTRGEKES
jgi:hypothetical protein